MAWHPSCSGRGASRARFQCDICLWESSVSQGLSAAQSELSKGQPVVGQAVVRREPLGDFWLLEQVVSFSTHVCWVGDASQEFVTCSSCKAPRWHLSCQCRAGHTNLKVSSGRAPRRPWLPTTALGKVCITTRDTQGSRDTELVGLPGPQSRG